MIVENDEPIFCFSRSNPENSSYGWCRTAGNYYDEKAPSQASDPNAWGFCSKDCHLNDPNQASYGVLRVADKAEMLEESQCEERVSQSVGFRPMQVRPAVLCVGKRVNWNVDVWTKDQNGYKRVKNKESNQSKKPFFFHLQSFSGPVRCSVRKVPLRCPTQP